MAIEHVVLGFDFGKKRIGVAVGYPEVRMASPLDIIATSDQEQRMAAIAKLVDEWKPSRLIVGLPTHADGVEHEMTKASLAFVKQLKSQFKLEVTLVDERYTSIIAEALLRSSATKKQHRENKGNIDRLSAQIIVQTYLDGLST